MGHIWFYLQVDVLGEILKVGGVVSLILAFGLSVVWFEWKKERKTVADLNATIRKDALDNLKIIDALTKDIGKGRDHDAQMLSMMTEALAILRERELNKLKGL